MKIEMNGDEQIVVYAVPGASAEQEARLQLAAAADTLHQLAADAHAKGMFLEGQSVRIEQLADGLGDDDVVRVRDVFVSEGVLKVQSVVAISAPGGTS